MTEEQSDRRNAMEGYIDLYNIDNELSFTLSVDIFVSLNRNKIVSLTAFLILTFLFIPHPVLGQYGFTPSPTQAPPAASAVVELDFLNAEDPDNPDPFATVKYEGAGVFQSGLPVNFNWQKDKVVRIGPDGYEDPGHGHWEPSDIRVCTDYDKGSETCTNGWQDDTQQLYVPSISGNATIEKTLAFEVEGGGEAISSQLRFYGYMERRLRR